MKKYILAGITCILCTLNIYAQDIVEIGGWSWFYIPNIVKITPEYYYENDSYSYLRHLVEYKNQKGENATVKISDQLEKGLCFYGGKGIVQNPITNEISNEENQDLYSWVEDVGTYHATVKVMFHEHIAEQAVAYSRFSIPNYFGYCISKTPDTEVSDSIIEGWSDHHGDSLTYDIGECKCLHRIFDIGKLDESSDYTLHRNSNDIGWQDKEVAFYADLQNLEYMTTYYIRPYIVIGVDNSVVMYGGEKSFTTPRTVEGALDHEEAIGKWHYYDSATGVVLTNNAMLQIIGYTATPDDNLQAGVIQDLKVFLTEEKVAQLKELSNNSIECVDGMLYLVDDVPADFVASFQDFLYSDYIAFSPIQHISSVDNMVGETLEILCDESWGVPYNSYLEITPATSTAHPGITMGIPQYLFPRTYSIYAVFVHPDAEIGQQGNKFRIYMTDGEFENQILKNPNENAVDAQGNSLYNTNNFVTDSLKRVDTIFIGNYTFSGAPNAAIQFKSYFTSTERNFYTRIMRIAQVYLVATEEEEVEQ